MRIFNRIRRKLLDELKIKNYFFYALGEIVLIVVGILLALQINNWNADRRSAKQERQLLVSLRQNFRSNDAEIERGLTELARLRKILELRIARTGPAAELPPRGVIDTIRTIDLVMLAYIFGGSSPALSQDEATLLDDADLIAALDRYPIEFLRYKAVEANLASLTFQLRENHQRYVSLLTEDYAAWRGARHEALHESDYLGWLRDRDHQNTAVESKWKVAEAISELQALREDNGEILALIEADLSGSG